MDDLQAKERLELHSQRDYKSTVEHDAVTLVKHDDALTVDHNKTDRIKKSYSMQAGSVSISCGPYSLAAKTIKVTSTEATTVDAAGLLSLHSSQLIALGAPEVEVDASKITLTAGGSSIVIDASGVTIVGALIKLN